MSLFKSVGKALKKVAKGVGKAVKTVAPIASTFLPGPIGTVAGLVTGGLGGATTPRVSPANQILQGLGYAAMPGGAPIVTAQRTLPVPRVPTLPSAAGRTATGAITTGATRRKMTPFGSIPRVAKAIAEGLGWVAFGAYWLSEGVVVAARTQRRMNPLNHRALRRAIRRVRGATRICNEVEKITRPRGRARRTSRSSRAEASCR